MKPETKVQRDVVGLYRRIGCEVEIRGGQPRPTMQSRGILDLGIFHRGKRLHWLHEVKVPGAALRPEQREKVELAQWCGVPVVVGGLHEALEFLREKGLAA